MTSPPSPRDWLQASPDRLRPALEGCASGALPPNVALLRLAIEASGPEEIGTALARAHEGASLEPADRAAAERLRDALDLWRRTPQAFSTVKAVIARVEHQGSAHDAERGLAYWAAAFDRMANSAPEGGVALYALGDPELLAAATAEVVGRLRDWELLGPDRRVLEIGCGIGRLVAALAPHVGHVTGLDISPGMIAEARRRCAGLPNLSLEATSGRDLSATPDAGMDLILAADVFPYLVQSGGGLAERHVEEAARVLAPGGHLAILNYSYRGDLARDSAEVAELAARSGFLVRRSAAGDFALWDAATFLLRKP